MVGREWEPPALQRAGLGASIPAAALQTACVCSGCSQRRGTSVPGLKAAGLRSEFGSWHGLGVWQEFCIPGGAGGTDLRLQLCTELQPLVTVTPSQLVGHPKGGFTHLILCSCGTGGRLGSPCEYPELPKGEANSPNTGWGFGASTCQLSSR